MHDQTLGLGKVETTRLTDKDLGRNTKVVNVGPFLLQTQGAFFTFTPMLPKEMSHKIWLCTVGQPTLPTEMVQFVLLHMLLQFLLIAQQF
jgi:hypothetical protein